MVINRLVDFLISSDIFNSLDAGFGKILKVRLSLSKYFVEVRIFVDVNTFFIAESDNAILHIAISSTDPLNELCPEIAGKEPIEIFDIDEEAKLYLAAFFEPLINIKSESDSC